MMSKHNEEGNSKRNGYLVYEGVSPGAFGVCHLRIIPGKKKTVLLASELVNNPGPSIANSVWSIWSPMFARELSEGVFPENILLIEHYNYQAIMGFAEGCERYDIVQIDPEESVRRPDNSICRSRQPPETIAELAGIYATDLEVDESILCVNPDDLEMEIRRDSQLFH